MFCFLLGGCGTGGAIGGAVGATVGTVVGTAVDIVIPYGPAGCEPGGACQ